MMPATLWLVAGPNGVGKTTFAFRQIRRLTGETSFVNQGEIARGLSPLAPESGAIRASRIALSVIDDLIIGNGRGRHSFSLETTLAGRTHLRTLDRTKAAGFRVHLLDFCVRTEEIALARIARRVAEGGHDVPEPDARRRFRRSLVAEGSGGVPAYVKDLSGLPDELCETLAALRLERAAKESARHSRRRCAMI